MSNLELVYTALYILSILFGISFGFFRLLDAAETNDEKKETQKKYLRLWAAIDRSKILQLPEKVINWFLSLRTFIPRFTSSMTGASRNKGKTSEVHFTSPIHDLTFGMIIGFLITIAVWMISMSLTSKTYENLNNLSLQVLAANAICDGLTLILTFLILSRVRHSNFLLILIAIALDFLLAALLSCCSLYLALVGTPDALDFKKILNILVARSVDGVHWEFGPYFWIMHTTFLPTLCYLSVLFLVLTAKIVILPFAKISRKASSLERPHWLTAVTFGFLSLLFGGIATIMLLLWLKK